MDLLPLVLPTDPEYLATRREAYRRMAARLSDHGWKFWLRSGPRGAYYEGYGPRGARIMSAQNADMKEALLEAIEHATRLQFPKP